MALSLIAISYCTLWLYKYCMKISRDEKVYRQRCISNSVSQKHYLTDMSIRLCHVYLETTNHIACSSVVNVKYKKK